MNAMMSALFVDATRAQQQRRHENLVARKASRRLRVADRPEAK
ncbi:MAG: hypothetical protein WBB30_02325 [Solirubrobacterales bacterium]|jgi:hypothetical protein